MVTKTSQKIQEYILIHKQVTGKSLANDLGITRQALYKHLSKLLDKGIIGKVGKPPVVYYFIKNRAVSKTKTPPDIRIDSPVIEKNYLLITSAGKRLEGMRGFSYWCAKNNLPLAKTVREYEKTFHKYNRYKKSGLIDGGYKLKHTFPQVFLDKIYYLDFYSIERFGKTKLGSLLLYAKQSQNKSLITELAKTVKNKILALIVKYKIDAVGFIPPTVRREIQLMNELQKNFSFSLPAIDLKKVKTEVIVPQKTLVKLEERIENARETIFLANTHIYKNVLLLDDAVGSGSTLNETARKLKERKIAKKIIGLAITGSFKGFEIISEV